MTTVSRVRVVGGAAPSGAYLLRIAVAEPLEITFGRFQGGRPVAVPAGTVVYVGSAMGRRGSATLARRLLRHATRSAGPPHALRATMVRAFAEPGLAPPAVPLRPPARKRLHWHVDYLLEQPSVTLTHVLAIRSASRLEDALAAHLAADPATAPLAPGLGASDAADQTHLLRAPGALEWWWDLAASAASLLCP